ncbi:MAG: hypothetical protein A2293_02005 [Elusimicrobia bacterium RIFOXYB2_FULL_49_7]|nr:MAG: hypothetical protein A2293_02005 [Elusimicrobia bacterium RIFOXYB2_FULL_49_7]
MKEIMSNRFRPNTRPASDETQRLADSAVQTAFLSGKSRVKIVAFLFLTAFINLLFPTEKLVQSLDVPKEGDITKRTVIAPFTFDILKTEEELKRERNEAILRVLPVMEYDYEVNEKIIDKFRDFFLRIEQLKDPILPDSQKKILWEKLHNNISTPTIRALIAAKINPENFLHIIDRILDQGLSSVCVVKDIKNRSEETVPFLVYPGNFVTLLRDDRERPFPAESLVTKDAVLERERAGLKKKYTEPQLSAIYEVLYAFLSPNLFYLEDETHTRREKIVASLLPTRGKVVKDLEIVGRNQLVTPDVQRKLYSLKMAQEAQGTIHGFQAFFPVLGRILLTTLLLLLFFLYSHVFHPKRLERLNDLLALCLIAAIQFIFITLTWHAIHSFLLPLEWENELEYGLLFPMVVGPMLCTILFDLGTGLAFSLTASLLLGLVTGYDFPLMFIHLLASFAACAAMRDIRYRSHFFTALFFYSLTYLFLVHLFALARPGDFSLVGTFRNVGLASLSGLLSMMLTIPFVWIFEKVFSITTNLTLIELSDMNSPVLKILSLKAPGTYHHSILVGNLAEAGAEAIGANPLKARVLAYYHDIGKVNKPAYFIENQTAGQDTLYEKISPRMSALIISSHVKLGVEMARRYKLHQAVIDVIREHHGTTLISFFYDKAKELAPDDNLLRDDFCYPGPKPSTKENALIMLADSVEAASRTLTEPTTSRLKNLVNSLIDGKIADGQLDNCDLTFIDLARIKRSFLPVLTSMFHTRIEYPDGEAARAEKTKTITV